jgi:hypothetical protein
MTHQAFTFHHIEEISPPRTGLMTPRSQQMAFNRLRPGCGELKIFYHSLALSLYRQSLLYDDLARIDLSVIALVRDRRV